MSSAELTRKLRLFGYSAIGARRIRVDGLKIWAVAPGVSARMTRVLYKGAHEWPERMMTKRVLRPGDRVLEMGAGVGLVTLTAARIVGAENVLAYEAQADLAPVIEANFALNGWRAQVRPRAMAREAGAVRFFEAERSVTSSYVDGAASGEAGETREIPADAIDDVLAEFRPTVLILDVEGAEVDILAETALPGVRAIVMERHGQIVGAERDAAMMARLASLGFAPHPDGEIKQTIGLIRRPEEGRETA